MCDDVYAQVYAAGHDASMAYASRYHDGHKADLVANYEAKDNNDVESQHYDGVWDMDDGCNAFNNSHDY